MPVSNNSNTSHVTLAICKQCQASAFLSEICYGTHCGWIYFRNIGQWL